MPALIDRIRDRITVGTTGLFKHARYPLEHTMSYEGDPGAFGPGSATWFIVGDVSAFLGGIRALLLQAAHPEVVAGVHDHSRYREDPLGRLSRTSAYVTATAYGAEPEIDAAVAMVRRAHRRVEGISHRGQEYSADAAPFAAWVHNALTDSFLVAYRYFGRNSITRRAADRYVTEQAEIGRRLDADPIPETSAGLSAWISDHPDLAPSPGMREAVSFLEKPPLGFFTLRGYRVLFHAAAATLPERIRDILGIQPRPGAIFFGGLMIRALRWALGSSPSWNLALIRSGAPIPEGLFKQPLPVELGTSTAPPGDAVTVGPRAESSQVIPSDGSASSESLPAGS